MSKESEALSMSVMIEEIKANDTNIKTNYAMLASSVFFFFFFFFVKGCELAITPVIKDDCMEKEMYEKWRQSYNGTFSMK